VHLSQKQATGQQLIDKICEKLNLLEKEYFSCTYTQRDVKVKKCCCGMLQFYLLLLVLCVFYLMMMQLLLLLLLMKAICDCAVRIVGELIV